MVEAFNKHNVALLDDLIAPDYFDHRHQLQGLESYKQFLTTFFKGFPDYHESIEDMVAEGDKVWIREKVTGTHTGEYRGIAPTGTKIAVTSVVILRIVDGKVAEWREFADFPSLLDVYKRLGVIEYKGFQRDDSLSILIKRVRTHFSILVLRKASLTSMALLLLLSKRL